MPLRASCPTIDRHRHIALFGMGASGAALTRLLAARGHRVRACDHRAIEDFPELPAEVERVAGRLDAGEASAVVLTPALHPDWPENREKPEIAALLQRAAAGEVELLSEVIVACELFEGPVVAVGGTDGKSTTAALTHHLLRAALPGALLGGNSWRPLSEVLHEAPDAPALVAEVSAFQLWDPHRLEPAAGLMTNIADDHLDHFANRDDYVAAKRRMVAHMRSGPVALHAEDPVLRTWREPLAAAGATPVGVSAAGRPAGWEYAAWRDAAGALHVEIPAGTLRLPGEALPLPGDHNVRNALCALIGALHASREAGTPMDAESAEAALRTFRGLPHRLELVGERRGARWINDSKATNVHAATVALRSMRGEVVAIVGGVDKGLPLDAWIDALAATCRAVIATGPLRARLAEEAARRAPALRLIQAEDLAEAVTQASTIVPSGGTVLFSPGASSFDAYRSFEARGDHFRTLVDGLPEA